MRNTKQYIGIFMFLFGVLLFTYSMYYFFGNGKEDIDDMKVIISGDTKVSDDDNFEDMLETDEVANISDNEIIEDLFASNDSNNQGEEIFDEPMMGTENDQEDIVDTIDDENDINIDFIEPVNGEGEINEDIIMDEQPIEDIPREVIIGYEKGFLIEDNRLTEIHSIYEILGFAENYPVYSFDTDISISGLQDKIYEDEYARINDLVTTLDGTVLQLNLFGEKQFFVNIPTYYKKKVIMGIEKMGVTYIVIVDYDIYQQKKEFIGNLFSK